MKSTKCAQTYKEHSIYELTEHTTSIADRPVALAFRKDISLKEALGKG